MNREIKLYAELDTLFDYRRGLLQWLMTEGIEDDDKRKAEGDRLWDLHIAKIYKERRMDVFDFPGFKLDAKFKELYKKRSISNWLMYYPTNFGKEAIKTILDLEGFTDKPIDVKGITLFLNIAPYELDEEAKEELIEHCTRMFKGLVRVSLVDQDTKYMDASYYSRFNYVYRYDILSGENTETFMKSLKDTPIPEVTFIVPDLLIKEVDTLTGDVADRIFALSIVVAPSMKLIPISHSFFDCSE